MQENGLTIARDDIDSASRMGSSRTVAARLALASLPVFSFAFQLLFSWQAGTMGAFIHHPTVMFVDWIFVPYNFLVASVIDWKRGGTLYLITAVSVSMNVLTHAYWQYNQLDPGHMISRAGVVLPAGWVHLAFSTLEMTLLVAFVFCRRVPSPAVRTATALAVVYFILTAVSGYAIQRRFIVSDVVVSVSGLLLMLLYPRFSGRSTT